MTIETKAKRRRRSERNAALYDEDTLEFIQAIDTYRRRFDRSFPAWSEVLSILKSLGYRRVAEPVPLEVGLRGDVDQAQPVQEAIPEQEPVEPQES